MVDSLPPDHYAALGLAKDATPAQVRTAYKKAALKHHPDKAQDKADAAEQFHKISQAYETLVDDDKRRQYEDSVRLAQLKRNLDERRGGGVGAGAPPPPNYTRSASYTRSPSGDVRYTYAARSPYSGPSAFSQSRVYEERRPRERSFDDDYPVKSDDIRFTSRKYPDYGPSPKRSTFARHEELRRPSREERPSSRAKASARKQREQEIKRDRQFKRFSTPSLDSDSSDTDDGRRGDPFAGAERHRSGDTYEDRYGRLSKEAQAREYMGRPPPRSPSPPPYRKEAFQQHQAPSRERVGAESRRDSYESRPNMRRTASSKQNDSHATARSRPTLVRETSGTRKGSRTPEEDRRPPPRMPDAASAPSGSAKLHQMVNNRRAAAPDESNKQARQMPRRAETAPGLGRMASARAAQHQPSASRRRSEHSAQQPLHGASNLRYQEKNNLHKNNNDSGYSTSSPSEEVPPDPEAAPNAKKQTYHYAGAKQAFVETDSDDSEEMPRPTRANSFKPAGFRAPPVTEIRTPNNGRRISRSPSPMGEKDVPRSRANSMSNGKHYGNHSHSYSSAAERAAGPPTSHSAWFAHEHLNGPSSTAATAGSASDREHYAPPRNPVRRPSLGGRSNSAKAQLNRANSMPVNTAMNGSTDMLFNEIPRTYSPVDGLLRSDEERRHHSDRERERRRATEDSRARRGDDRRSKREDVQMAKAKQHMRESGKERSRSIRAF